MKSPEMSEGVPAPTEEQIMQMIAMLQEQGITPEELKETPDLEQLLDKVKLKKGVPLDKDIEEITPEPGFVIKTLNEDGQKVFINVCGHDRIPSPGGWSDGQIPESVRQALENAENLSPEEASVLRFPLSLGPARYDTDRKGERCRVFDTVLNRDVVKQAAVVKRLKAFLIELCLGWVAQKAKCTLDPKYKLPKMKYKGGDVAKQAIRADKKKLIEEVGDVPEEPSFALPTKKVTPEQQQQAQKLSDAMTRSTDSSPNNNNNNSNNSNKSKGFESTSSKSSSSFSFGESKSRTTESPKLVTEIKDSRNNATSISTTAVRTNSLSLEELLYEGRPVAAIALRVVIDAAAASHLMQQAEKEAEDLGGRIQSSTEHCSPASSSSLSTATMQSDRVLSRFRIQMVKGGQEIWIRFTNPNPINGKREEEIEVLKVSTNVPVSLNGSGICGEEVRAELSEDCRSLTVKLPVVTVRQRLEMLRKQKPMAFGSLDLHLDDEALDLEP